MPPTIIAIDDKRSVRLNPISPPIPVLGTPGVVVLVWAYAIFPRESRDNSAAVKIFFISNYL